MPQERIHTDIPPYDVRVGWSRNGDVQVGVGEYEDRSLLWMLFGDEENLQRVRKGLEAYKLQNDVCINIEDVRNIFNLIESKDEAYTYSSVWSTLNREECNRLIRTIRKARDQAFGRDE